MKREEAIETIKVLAKYSAYWVNVLSIIENKLDLAGFDRQISQFKDNWELTFNLDIQKI